MKVQIEMELDDAMHILAAFSPNSKNKGEGMQRLGEEALNRMAKQVDEIVEGLDNEAEGRFH